MDARLRLVKIGQPGTAYIRLILQQPMKSISDPDGEVAAKAMIAAGEWTVFADD